MDSYTTNFIFTSAPTLNSIKTDMGDATESLPMTIGDYFSSNYSRDHKFKKKNTVMQKKKKKKIYTDKMQHNQYKYIKKFTARSWQLSTTLKKDGAMVLNRGAFFKRLMCGKYSSRADKVTSLRFICHHKPVENWAQCINRFFSDIGEEVIQDSEQLSNSEHLFRSGDIQVPSRQGGDSLLNYQSSY